MDLIFSFFIQRLELINTIIFGLSGPMADFSYNTFTRRLKLINNYQFKLLFLAYLDL